MRRRRYEVTEMYALIEISNQMLEDSAFDHGRKFRATGKFALIADLRRVFAVQFFAFLIFPVAFFLLNTSLQT